MNPLYSVAQIRETERLAGQRLPEGTLMQRAGQAAANLALDLLPLALPFADYRAAVLVLAGPGNNGGDAFELAAHVAHAGAHVTIMHLAGTGPASPERDRALQRARSSPALFVDPSAENIHATAWHLAIDGLFGIGLQRPLSGLAAALVAALDDLDCPILALDVPSGLDADTGTVVGPDGSAVRASHTVTFIGDKPGLYTADGRDHAGNVTVSALDIEAALYAPATMHLNDPAWFARYARARRQNSHKGSYGNVAILGGATGMAGAPLLAARAGLHAGAGRVYACFAGAPLALDPGQPELMCRAARGFDFRTAVTVAGPGLGTDEASAALLLQVLDVQQPLVLDADALNLLASHAVLRTAVAGRALPALLTPHPLEAARLLDTDSATVQADRLAAARALASRFHAIVILKGAGTVIAAPDGRLMINTTGNPALATAGTGDVLAGLAGALLAQGWPAWEAALAATWLHGMAADVLVSDGSGPIGLTAGELVPAIRVALNRLVALHPEIKPGALRRS